MPIDFRIANSLLRSTNEVEMVLNTFAMAMSVVMPAKHPVKILTERMMACWVLVDSVESFADPYG